MYNFRLKKTLLATMITDYYCVSGKNNSKVSESLLQLSMPGPAVNEGGRRREGEGREKWEKESEE